MDTYRDYLMGSKSKRTAGLYMDTLRRFVGQGGDKDAGALDIRDFLSYKAHLVGRGGSSSYVATEVSGLSFYVGFLRKILKISTVIQEDLKELRPKVTQKIPGSLEKWEVDALIEAAIEREDRMLVLLLYQTGLRAQELLGLTEGSIVDRDMMIGDTTERVRWFVVKGKGGDEKGIPLLKQTAEEVDAYVTYLKARYPKWDGRLFRMSYKTAWRRIREMAKRAGISSVHPHLLRHTFATHLLAQKEQITSIATLMGHKSLDTTRRYAKTVDAALVEAVRKLG